MITEEQVKELESKLTSLQSLLEAKTAQCEGLEAQIKEKDETILSVSNENKRLDKELTIMKGNIQAEKDAADIEAVTSKRLAESTLLPALHDKVKAMVNAGAFKAADGQFDKKAFAEAFDAEVKSWEDAMPKTSAIGAGDPKESAKTEYDKYKAEFQAILN